MTPKEKAIELVEKYFQLNYGWDGTSRYQLAKECALIAVDEMQANAGMIWGNNQAKDEFRNYWQEVKQEIEKL